MLKTRQALGYFPALTDIPEATIAYIAGLLGLSPASMNDVSRPTLYRYRSVIRTHLAVRLFDDAGERLLRHWGSGQAAIADGTHVKLREQQSHRLPARALWRLRRHRLSPHRRHLHRAVHHLHPLRRLGSSAHSGRLLKNRSQLQPDTLHADTHGQSEPVVGLSRLLGVTLMPRMRTWADVAFYRPSGSARCRHIDPLFTRAKQFVAELKTAQRYQSDVY